MKKSTNPQVMTLLRTKGHKLTSIYNYLDITRQAYHKRIKQALSKQDLYNSMEQIVIDNRKKKSRVGPRGIYHKEGLSSSLGINKFEEQMSMLGYALKPYKSFMKMTNSRGTHYMYDKLNLRQRN